MKIGHWLLSVAFVCSLSSCKKEEKESITTPPEVGFEKHIGGLQDDEANSVVFKNGYVFIFGTSKSFGDINGDHYLIKLDSEGDIVFEKTYGGSLEEKGAKILATKDGNFLLIGSTKSTGNGQKDIHVMKVNEQGDLLWEKVFGGALDDVANSIIETNNAEFCIIGNTQSFGRGSRDMYVVWINQEGDLIRQTSYGGVETDGGADLVEVDNNDLMLFGYTRNFGATSIDLFLLRINALGDSLWSQRYGGDEYEESQAMVQTPQGDLLLHGHSSSTDPNHDMYTVKVDKNGNQLWAKNYGGSQHDGGHALLVNNAGNYVLVARSMSFGNGDRNIYLVTTTPDGNIISEDVIGGEKDDWGQDIIEVGAFYYIVGHSNSMSDTQNDVYVVKYKK